MADPVGIAIAPNDSTFSETPTWIRLDDTDQPWRVTGFEVSRGKPSEFDRNDPGRAQISLIDRDGSFDPTNPSAPFPLTLAAQAAITVQNPVTGEWRHLFKGFTKEYPGDFYPTGNLAEVPLQLGDGFDYLNGVLMSPADPVRFGDTPPAGIGRTLYYPETDGTGQVRARLNQALDNADWPASWRHTFSGNVSLQAWQYPVGTPLMTVLEEAVEAEFPAVGVHFMSRRGNYVFRGRYPRFDPDSYLSDDGDDIRAGPAGEGGRLVRWKVGGRPQAAADLGSEAEGYRDGTAVIADLAYRHSWEDVINAAIALPEGVDEGDVPDSLFTDGTSIAQYGWRFGPDMQNLLVLHGNTPPGRNAVEETALYAEYWVENFKQPVTRLTRLFFRPRDATNTLAPALWAFMLGVELGDPVDVLTDHYGREGFNGTYFIQGIRYRATNLGRPGLPDIEMELDVSPAGFYAHNPWGTTEDGDVESE